MKQSTKRIVVYSHDTFGLGNIRRMLAICQHILDTHEEVSLLLISGSPQIQNLELPSERFDYIKLPCLSRDENGKYQVKLLGSCMDDVVALRAQAIKNTIEQFRPDLVLVDKKPLGVAGELQPVLEAMESQLPRTRWVLLLRDILDTPITTREIWLKNAYQQTIKRFYDLVLVVGSSDVYDIRSEYALSNRVSKKVIFCGYLRRLNESDRVSNEENTVLVTPGGGEDGFELIRAYLDGLAGSPLPDHFGSQIITGPEMAPGHVDWIRDTASRLPHVTIKRFTHKLHDHMRRARLILSMGGYNTLCEVLSLGRRAIVVPRVHPVQEQLIRAERFAQRGLLRYIHPSKLSPELLLRAVNEELAKPQARCLATRALDFNGLENVSRCVGCLLQRASTDHHDHPQEPDYVLRPPRSANHRLSGQNLAEGFGNLYFAGGTRA